MIGHKRLGAYKRTLAKIIIIIPVALDNTRPNGKNENFFERA